jgi:dienelactone hydrolase
MPNRPATRWRALAPVALAAALALAAGCSSSGTGTSAASTAPFQNPGPHPVGVTTLDLGSAGATFGERLATVFYPADPATLSGHAHFSYTEASTLPSALQGILPARYNTVTTTAAWAGAPGARTGPFPVVLFSHGFGGERLYYSKILTGIASWGYVVVSADYLERGLAAQALRTGTASTPAQDSAIMRASLDAVERASAQAGSVLHGTVDRKKVAAVGHSAGGQTAFDALDSPGVSTAVGWAPVGPAGAPSAKPVMLIVAAGDRAVPPARVQATYRAFRGPKVLVEISGEGHNTYTDICEGIRSGGGLISYAVQNHFTSPQLAELGINGCQPTDLAPARFWPIVQYYTVLQLHDQLGGGGNAVVPAPPAGRFPGFTVTVTQSGTGA